MRSACTSAGSAFALLWAVLGTASMAAEPPPSAPLPGGDWMQRVNEHIARREYWASPNQRGLQAPNRRHQLRTYFEPTGARVVDRTAAGAPLLLQLRLTGLGRGTALEPVRPGEVKSEENRVEIRRPDLIEWYVNGVEGLEQGFTLAKRPEGTGPLLLDLDVAPARAVLAGDAVELETPAGRWLRYEKLVATDASGAAVVARLETPAPDRVRIVVDDEQARYPLVIDPLVTGQEDNWVASDQAFSYYTTNPRLTPGPVAGTLAGAGDVNGDGYADVIVGAPWYDAGTADEGVAFIYHGSASGTKNGLPAVAADTQLEGNLLNAHFGASVAGAGDVNGDGYDDVIVGSPGHGSSPANEGVAFVFHGGPGGISDGGFASAQAALESDEFLSQMGASVAGAGDVNGDGYADVIVGAPHFDGAAPSDSGAAFIFLGSASGVVGGGPAQADTRLTGAQASTEFGISVDGAGDVNRDGYSDVIVGAWRWEPGAPSASDNNGAAYIFEGGASGIAHGDLNTASTSLEMGQLYANFGFSVAGAGDLNGDGYSDVIVGAPQYDFVVQAGGAAYIFHGQAGGIPDSDPQTGANTRLWTDQFSSLFGTSVAGAGDVNGDGYSDVIVGSEFYENGEAEEGAAFVFLGSAAGMETGLASAKAWAQLEADRVGGGMGNGVAGAGDVNGDGFADVIVGIPRFIGGGTVSINDDVGRAYVYFGGNEGVTDGDPSTASALFQGDQSSAQLGASVAGAGDVNRDGYGDIIVGAPGYDAGEQYEGAVFIFHGSSGGIASASPATADTQLEGNQAFALFGSSAAGAGDVNGDGYSDVIVGAWYYDGGDGAAFVFHGGPGGVPDGDPASADTRLVSDQASAFLGRAVDGAGDVNGDGYADVIVGADGYDNGESDEGMAFVFLGTPSGIPDGGPSTALTELESNQANAAFGRSVAGAGDVNGDGFADVIVGASDYADGETQEGGAFIFHGSAAGVPNASAMTAATVLQSNQAYARLGRSVAGAGDVNGDGFADVIVGAYGYDSGEVNEGAAFVFEGGPSGIPDGNPFTADSYLQSNSGTGFLGHSVAGAGDVNGDGFADIIVGALNYNGGGTQEGAAFLWLGSPNGIAALGTPANAWAQLASNQDFSDFGESVASAGDVNGDGFADVIVGADAYDAGSSDEGAAFLFLGNGGRTGRRALANQRRGGDVYTIVQPWGLSHDTSQFYGSLYAYHPDGYGRVKQQFQWCPPGVPFGDAQCGERLSTFWIDIPVETNYALPLPGLAEGQLYRWRVRLLYAPQDVTKPGITPAPNPPHGPWRRVMGQAVEGDVRIVPEPGALVSLAAGLALVSALARGRVRRRQCVDASSRRQER